MRNKHTIYYSDETHLEMLNKNILLQSVYCITIVVMMFCFFSQLAALRAEGPVN